MQSSGRNAGKLHEIRQQRCQRLQRCFSCRDGDLADDEIPRFSRKRNQNCRTFGRSILD